MNYYTGVISYGNKIIIIGKQLGTFWLGLLLSSEKWFKEWRRKYCCFLFFLNILLWLFFPPWLYFICFHALPLLYSLFKFYNNIYWHLYIFSERNLIEVEKLLAWLVSIIRKKHNSPTCLRSNCFICHTQEEIWSCILSNYFWGKS